MLAAAESASPHASSPALVTAPRRPGTGKAHRLGSTAQTPMARQLTAPLGAIGTASRAAPGQPILLTPLPGTLATASLAATSLRPHAMPRGLTSAADPAPTPASRAAPLEATSLAATVLPRVARV